MNTRPQTYNQAKRLFNCMRLKNYFTWITNNEVINFYQFLSENPGNSLEITEKEIHFRDPFSRTIKTVTHKRPPKNSTFGTLILKNTSITAMLSGTKYSYDEKNDIEETHEETHAYSDYEKDKYTATYKAEQEKPLRTYAAKQEEVPKKRNRPFVATLHFILAALSFFLSLIGALASDLSFIAFLVMSVLHLIFGFIALKKYMKAVISSLIAPFLLMIYIFASLEAFTPENSSVLFVSLALLAYTFLRNIKLFIKPKTVPKKFGYENSLHFKG